MPSLRHLGGKMFAVFRPTRRQDRHQDRPIRKLWPSRLILDIPQETNDGSSSPTMTSFPQFSRLPLELRQLIWSFGVGPRVVPVSLVRELNNMPYGAVPDERSCVDPDDWILKCFVPPPATLFVCKESRAVAEEQYKKAFTGRSDLPRYTAWIDFDRDILDLGESVDMLFPGELLRNIQTLRLYKSDELEFRKNVGFLKFVSKHYSHIYSNVREIQVVCVNGVEAWTGVDATGPGPDQLESVWLIDHNTGERIAYDLSWMQTSSV